MPRRANNSSSEDDPPKKKTCSNSFDLRHGEYLKDITGKQWKLGKPVGVGGFGEIYLASDVLTKEVKTDCQYVAKVESHKNGPLFVEVNCYLRIAKREMIEEWKRAKNISSLGMPHYVASGSHVHKGEKYRFLILPKFDRDLEKVLQEKKILNLKTVLTISLQIIDVLEYIHSKGYMHSDIKASNILLSNQNKPKPTVCKRVSSGCTRVSSGCTFTSRLRACRKKPTRITRNLRPNAKVAFYLDDIPNFNQIFTNCVYEKPTTTQDQIYLLDYGLASKFLTSNGEHKPFCVDERKAHAGTVLFCSRDAHKGVHSRRSDLESLGYNIIYWLTGTLPWAGDADNPEIVAKKKQRAMADVEYFMNYCFSEYPKFLEEYFKYIQKLEFQEKPDYSYCKKLFRESLKTNGYKDDSRFDFDNVQRNKLLKPTRIRKRTKENIRARKFIHTISRLPLQSNIPIKPLLRKKVKNKKVKPKANWFGELTDPEIILKQARKNSENTDANLASNVAELDINALNPTYAMIEVYNKCRERIDASPTYKSDSCIETVDGYTSAMMSVLEKMKKRRELELEEMAVNLSNTRSGRVQKRIRKPNRKYESPDWSPPQTRTSKPVIKKDQARKVKSGVLRRTYSLRG
ncbi:hypothetical protein TcasGA2_TC003370 [Tribolium castaneum]|uniref:non-specific serine/threonine protein kinase n=1 Tax=Tribolium castaneum TaxID=7070 RepID=D6WFP2_TRICA|nr:PREDICTED: serine/threonine-protein kinase VRK1 isoform X1 [Tribolium castaneum]EFA00506.1 hypothetical protein TcasGA2_TC003370 [Tribolium castaneum]|eukprot:XP_968040.2 PREDICTED: serine/threonine-protein kinase VRK1 isoform X1 [Tribolium castaneum]